MMMRAIRRQQRIASILSSVVNGDNLYIISLMYVLLRSVKSLDKTEMMRISRCAHGITAGITYTPPHGQGQITKIRSDPFVGRYKPLL